MYFAIAKEPPSTLKAFKPNRHDSSLINTDPTPSKFAIFFKDTSGVGAYCGKL